LPSLKAFAAQTDFQDCRSMQIDGAHLFKVAPMQAAKSMEKLDLLTDLTIDRFGNCHLWPRLKKHQRFLISDCNPRASRLHHIQWTLDNLWPRLKRHQRFLIANCSPGPSPLHHIQWTLDNLWPRLKKRQRCVPPPVAAAYDPQKAQSLPYEPLSAPPTLTQGSGFPGA
jgi:hypothetical protein